MHEALYNQLLILGVIQFLLVGLIVYKIYMGRKEIGREWLMKVFVIYAMHLLLFIGENATHADLIYLFDPEVLSLLHHFFFTLVFIIFGYGLVDAITTQPLHKRILKHNTILTVSLITFITLAMILLESEGLKFSHTSMEFIYEIIQAIVNLLIIVVLYNSWRETGSRRLMLDTLAISLFFLGNTGHILTIIATVAMETHLQFTIAKYVMFTFALIIFAYIPSSNGKDRTGQSHTGTS